MSSGAQDTNSSRSTNGIHVYTTVAPRSYIIRGNLNRGVPHLSTHSIRAYIINAPTIMEERVWSRHCLEQR